MANPNGGPPKYKAETMATALAESKGLVSVTAKRLSCSPTTVRAYIRRYPTVKQVVDDSRESITDLAELKLWDAINRGEPWAIQFWLRTQARERGYSDRYDLATFLRERAEELAAERGLDKALTLQSAERIISEHGARARG
jgi:hypothetical protein